MSTCSGRSREHFEVGLLCSVGRPRNASSEMGLSGTRAARNSPDTSRVSHVRNR